MAILPVHTYRMSCRTEEQDGAPVCMYGEKDLCTPYIRFFAGVVRSKFVYFRVQTVRSEMYAFRASKTLEIPTFFRPHIAGRINLYHPPPEPGIMALRAARMTCGFTAHNPSKTTEEGDI